LADGNVNGTDLGGYFLANATLYSQEMLGGLQLSQACTMRFTSDRDHSLPAFQPQGQFLLNIALSV